MPQQQFKRQLRMEIARLRRRIDHRLYATKAQTVKLASWRTYVRRYPAASALAALGAGLALAAGFRRGRLVRWAGSTLLRASMSHAMRDLRQELWRFWNGGTSGPASQTAGEDAP
jgi:hypothetical protein